MSAYNQAERPLWKTIAEGAGATIGFNDPIRQIVVKWAIAEGCSVAATYSAPLRQLLILIAVARGVAVPYGATRRTLLKALAVGSGAKYNDSIRQLLLRLAGG